MANFHVINGIRIGRELSWKLTRLSISTLLYFSKPFQTERRFRKVLQKHEFVLNYLDGIYKEDLLNYKDNSATLPESTGKNIWLFWNSGEAGMPPIVKLCYQSVLNHANGAQVHLLTMDTIKDYLDIPDYIMQRYKNGRMTMAFLTDYLRICLLERYGGLWLDATIFVSQDIPSSIFNKAFFTLHTAYEKTIFVNDNKVHCYVMGGKKGFSFFTYVRNEVEKYWKTHDFMVDYYLLDYTIMHAYKNNAEVRSMIDGLETTPSSLYELVASLNDELDENKLLRICSENIFSKLNWRVRPKLVIHGERTMYAKLQEEVFRQ